MVIMCFVINDNYYMGWYMRVGEKRRAIRRSIKSENPNVVFLQQIKLKNSTWNLYGSIWCKGQIKGVSVHSEAWLGGLMTIWRDEFFVGEEQILNKHFILVIGTIYGSIKTCGLLNIYAPNYDNERLLLYMGYFKK